MFDALDHCATATYMINQRSPAIRRCTAELAKTIQQEGCAKPRLSAFTDGGGGRNITNLAVQKAIIALFLKLDIDEAIFARNAANCSFGNPVDRMLAIANIRLQSVGIMRTCMPERAENFFKNSMETLILETFAKRIVISNREFRKPEKMIETVLSELSLKGTPFKLFELIQAKKKYNCIMTT